MSDDLHRRVIAALSRAVPLDLLEAVPVAKLADAVVAELTRTPAEPDLTARPCDCTNAAACYGGQTVGHWVPADLCRQFTVGFGAKEEQ